MDAAEWPLRLIDVGATLQRKTGVCFSTPTGWGFHVISHTWSQAIRDLSVTIGKMIDHQASRHGRVQDTNLGDEYAHRYNYNQAFERENLVDAPCFSELMDFLQLLRTDGVTEIWFDALCINQVDVREKGREIAKMAAYYQYSKGCYVLTHGIGKGYNLWEGPHELPRWFRRVWTLPELLYPCKLTFIVEKLKPVLKAWVNRYAEEFSDVGLCRCCISDLNGREVYMRLKPENYTGHIHSTDNVCSICGSLPLIRNAAGLPDVHFVDREAYTFLATRRGVFSGRLGASFFQIENRLKFIFSIVSREGRWNPGKLLTEVSRRHCSVEEDRILAILGPLGVDGTFQVRAGRTLDAQIPEIAKILDPDTLIRLCILDSRGYGKVGLSWAPHFATDNHRRTFYDDLQAKVDVVGVSARGISLRSKIAVGEIAHHGLTGGDWTDTSVNYPHDVHATFSSCLLEEVGGFYVKFLGQGEMNVPLQHRGGEDDEDPHWAVLQMAASRERHAALRFNVTAILMGESGDSQTLAMACVSASANVGGSTELHKIGFMSFPPDQAAAIFPSSTTAIECLVGGFGGNLSDHVKLSLPK